MEGRFYFKEQGINQNILPDAPSYTTKSEPDSDTAEILRQKEALELEKQELAREKQEMERRKAIDAEREQLAAERRRLEEERQKLALVTLPSVSAPREIKSDGRFIAYDNGTVLDTLTSLMWAVRDNGSEIKWSNAKSYCENYRGGGYADWRMPTQDELAGLHDISKPRPARCDTRYYIHLTELIDVSCFTAWAFETRSTFFSDNAANFDFVNGNRSWDPQGVDYFRRRALPVRFSK